MSEEGAGMSESLELMDVWRRTFDATVQFYSTIGGVVVDYLRSLLTPVESAQQTSTPQSATRTANPPAPTNIATMVMEAEDGAEAVGVFLVENLLPRAVTAVPTASDLLGENGTRIKSSLVFQPASITLAPGQQTLVRVVGSFGKKMKAGVRYHGKITVPGLSGPAIPLALIRKEKGGSSTATSPAKTRRVRKNGDPLRARTPKKKAIR
jgi:hypothetical protein